MKKLIAVAGMGVALCSATAFADPDPARVPLANAIEKVTENQAEHPGNRGLANARTKLVRNAVRQADKRANHPPGQNKAPVKGKTADGQSSGGSAGGGRDGGRGGSDRAQVVERVERTERAERPERVERVEKVDRVAARPDRPDHPSRPQK